jgi:hypothetical protein
MAANQNDVLSWTSQDPRQSQLFSPWGVVYRFQVCTIDIAYAPMALIQLPQTETNPNNGQSTTTVWRAIRANREDRVAKLEWAPGGGLGRAVIGKVRPSLRGIPHLTSFLRSYSITEPPSYGRLGPPGSKDACTFQFISISFHLTWVTRIREFSTAPMVSNTDGDRVLPTRTSW